MAANVKRCADCAHVREMQQQFFCCRYPPQVVAMPVINQITGQGVIVPQAKFPAVEREAWCSEYAEGVKNRVVS